MSNSIFENNKKILESINRQHLIKDIYYEIEKTLDNNYTFRYNCSGKKVYINSKYNLKNEIDMTFSNIDFNKDSLFIVFGIGLGYHIEELVKRSSKNSRIFIIEKDLEILNTYLRNKSMTDLGSEKIILFFGEEKEIISDISGYIFNFKVMPIARNYIPIVPVAYYSIYGNWINELNRRIIELLRNAFFNLGNDVEDTIIGLRNNFINLKELIKSPSIEGIENKYSGKPAIIVSAGPSLDKNIEELKNAQGKALILATDAVISTLNKNGIVPDAVFSIERIMLTYEKFYKNNEIDKSTVFVGPPVVVKEILEKMKYNKKLLCLKEGEAVNRWINNILHENRLLNMGTSCAHVALSFAQHVNANPIIFIGQDLAFTKEGVTHSKDVEVKNNINTKDENLFYVKSIDGEMLPTNYAFKNFLIYLETAIAKDMSGRIYIDATEGGAYKKGTLICTLKDTIKKYCNENIPRLYDIIPESNELNEEKLVIAKTELKSLQKKFIRIKEESLKQLDEIEEIRDLFFKAGIQFDKVLKVLKQKEGIIQYVATDQLLVMFLQSIIMVSKVKETELGNNINDEIMKEKIQIDRELVALLAIACNAVIKAIDELLNEVLL